MAHVIRCGEPQISGAECSLVERVMAKGLLSRGEMVSTFEGDLKMALGGRNHAHAVSSGTAALHLALLGLGVTRSHEVIVPACTFVATYNAVKYVGADPVVVDVRPDTWMPCEKAIMKAVTEFTKAIVVVNLYGNMYPSHSLRERLDAHYARTGQRIYLIEDAAQSFYSSQFCDVAAMSFYASKHITTGGEGGAVVTNDARVARRVQHLACQAMTAKRYVHDAVGYNYRMTEMQAAIGIAQLQRLADFMVKRLEVRRWYEERLTNYTFQVSEQRHWNWAIAVRSKSGNTLYAREVERRMAERGIETRPIFPPVDGEDRNVTKNLHNFGLVLPTHCGLTEDGVDRVCTALNESTK